jgi:hypothetical protein
MDVILAKAINAPLGYLMVKAVCIVVLLFKIKLFLAARHLTKVKIHLSSHLVVYQGKLIFSMTKRLMEFLG